MNGDKFRTPPPRPALEAIAAALPMSLFTLSPEGRYLFVNRSAKGAWPDEKAGKLLEETFGPGPAADIRIMMRRVASSGKPLTGAIEVPDERGRSRRYVVALAPLLVDGRLDGFAGAGIVRIPEDEETADARAKELAASLTPKQREVLVLVAEGLSSRAIAERLGVGERTVETHREQLMARLDIRGAAALARFAIEAGLL
jgi:DNA-binding CsgD family transcriptional regulator